MTDQESSREIQRLLTLDEAADLLNMSPAAYYKARRVGYITIPEVRIGGAIRVDPADLRAFIDSQKGAAK